jgi:hypothetical protein
MGELLSLTGGDLEFNGPSIYVQRNFSRGRISVTKNGKDRKLDMSAQLAESPGRPTFQAPGGSHAPGDGKVNGRTQRRGDSG